MPSEAAVELKARKIPFGFVNNMEEVFLEKGVDELVLEGTLPEGKAIRGTRSVAFEGTLFGSPSQLAPPPHFNQHSDEVLVDLLGYGTEEVSRLREQGAIL